MLTGVSWLTQVNRHLNRSREEGEDGPLNLFLISIPYFPVTCSDQSRKSELDQYKAMLAATAWFKWNCWFYCRCSLCRCSRKISKPTISVSTRLPLRRGAAELIFLWLERHKMIINLTKTFLFFFFPKYHGVFQFSLLNCRGFVLFCLFLTNTLQCKIFIFYWKMIHETGRNMRTIHITLWVFMTIRL